MTGTHNGCLSRRTLALASAFLLLVCAVNTQDSGTSSPLTLAEADRRLEVALRMLQGGIYDRALELADSVLDDPAALAAADEVQTQDWLARREAARFVRERGRLGLADSQEDIADIAGEFIQLFNNRYRLADPAYNVQSAYWAGRAFETIGDYREAVEYFSRVGGLSLPDGMEGDAAQRMSRSLRMLAEEIPYPGGLRDRQRRDRLLNQAIAELDRARLAFPVGNRRKEIELDLIALRMARRDEQSVREAATEAEAYIDSDPAKDELRARAALYRGQAASLLGSPQDATDWFNRVVAEEAPSDDDRRSAQLGLGLALVELAETAGGDDKLRLLGRASIALDRAAAGSMSPGPWDGARIIKARVQLELDQSSSALDTLRPVLDGPRVNPAAWQLAGEAEIRRGRLGDALSYLYPVGRPSTPSQTLRFAASRDASRTADARRDHGLALALNHQASRLLRKSRLFSSLLVSEFEAMEILLKLGKAAGPVSLSGDTDLLMFDSDAPAFSREEKQAEGMEAMAAALGGIFRSGGNPDDGYDLAVSTEAAYEWSGDGLAKLELAIAMISHLRTRQPSGVTDSVLSSRLGEARHALALARAERILGAAAPDESAVDRTLGDFAAAAASFQEASAGGFSLQDSLDQGMVNMESGAFLMRLSEKWERGRWAGRALTWREEARKRIEASLRPFNQAIATSGQSSLAARRAKWSRGRALELMGEWRGAASDYLSLMNNSELPRGLRANAARRWAVCMGRMGESRAALTRLAVFAEIDAEAALVAGHLAQEAGYPREAFQMYLFAADPQSPSLPPATLGRIQEAAYHAAKLALNDPNEANPLLPPDQMITFSRELLEKNALAELSGAWAIPMLNLLGESRLGDPAGWETVYRLATDTLERDDASVPVKRAMFLLAAKAQQRGGNYAAALDELDSARELIEDDAPASRADAALITLEAARIYRGQDRLDDALRAYADVFAVYPEQDAPEQAARMEAAVMLLSSPNTGSREQEQARGILSGLQDQLLARKIMDEYGIR